MIFTIPFYRLIELSTPNFSGFEVLTIILPIYTSFQFDLFSNSLLFFLLSPYSKVSFLLPSKSSSHSLAVHLLSATYISLAMPAAAPKHYLCNKPNDELGDHDGSNTNTVQDNNKKALKYIEDVTSNADEIQQRVLTEILSSSAAVEYLQLHGLDGRTDRDTFKKVMPVVTYEDLKPYIDRIANGDNSPILCSKPISEFLTRSVPNHVYYKLIIVILNFVQFFLICTYIMFNLDSIYLFDYIWFHLLCCIILR